MKKYLLLLTLFCCYQLNAQTYMPMPLEDGMIWREYYMYAFNLTGGYGEYKINGDTIILGNTYKKIVRKTYKDYWTTSFFTAPTCWYNAIRQDTINKKVYGHHIYGGDSLLYDFNLQVGDTIHSVILAYLRDAGVDTIRIGRIDSILINGVYHKQFFTDTVELINQGPHAFSYIEGIGFVEGFVIVDIGFERSSELECVGKNFNQSLYPDSTYNCIFATSLNDIQRENSLRIYPNPSSDFLRIHSTIAIMSIEIIDMLGHVVYTKSTNGSEALIPINELSNGIYSARILQSDGGVLVRKFVKE